MTASYSGPDLGEFWAAFRLDMSDLQKGRTEVAAFTKEIEKIGSSTRGAARVASNEIEGVADAAGEFAQGLRDFAGGIFGMVTSIAIPTAVHLRNLDLQFKNITGSEAEAASYLQEIRDLAVDLNQPFLNLADSAAMLVPMVRMANVELDLTMRLAQRLRILDPTSRPFDAAIAIREFMSGEYLSMTRRFELPRARLREIIEQSGGDVQKSMELLSDYLDELGITDETLRTMGEDGRYTFDVLGSNITEFIGNAGRPLVEDVLLPMADAANNAFEGIRRLGQGIEEVGGGEDLLRTVEAAIGILGVAYAGRTALSTGMGMLGRFNLVSEASRTAMTGLGNRLIPIAGMLASGYAGANLGGMAARDMANYGTLGMDSRLADMGTGDILNVAMTTAAVAAAEFGMRIRQIFTGSDMSKIDANKSAVAQAMISLLAGDDAGEALRRFGVEVEDATETVVALTRKTAAAGGNEPIFNEEVISAFSTYRDNVAKMEQAAATEREEIIQQHIDDVEDARLEYERDRAAEQEEFDFDETRRLEDHNTEMADIRQEADQQAVEDFNRYYRELERERRRHVYNLAVAAANLDAEAVANEKDRFALRVQEMEEGYTEEQAQNIAQREERIAQAAEEFDLETRRRAEDHTRKLGQMQEEFNLEMSQMGAETNQRLMALSAQLDAEKALEEERWIAEYNELVGHNALMVNTFGQGLAGLDAELAAWAASHGVAVGKVDTTNARFAAQTQSAKVSQATITPTPFYTGVSTAVASGASSKTAWEQAAVDYANRFGTSADLVTSGSKIPTGLSSSMYFAGMRHAGGDIFRDGLYALKAGERVTSADAIRRSGGTGVGGAGGSGVQIGNLEINVPGTPGSPEELREAVYGAVMEAFQEIVA